jgi:hypothetical protein
LGEKIMAFGFATPGDEVVEAFKDRVNGKTCMPYR